MKTCKNHWNPWWPMGILGDPWRPMGTHGNLGFAGFYGFFMFSLGFWALKLVPWRSWPLWHHLWSKNYSKRWDGVNLGPVCVCLFLTILEKSSPQISNYFRKSQSYTASQAKPLQGKWSYTDLLYIGVSSKVADLLVYTCFRELFLKNMFFILRRLRPVSI